MVLRAGPELGLGLGLWLWLGLGSGLVWSLWLEQGLGMRC